MTIISQVGWFDVESQNAKNLDTESKTAESQGDFKTASRKAKQVVDTYLTVLEKFKSSKQPDREGTETLESMIASAIDRAKLLDTRAKASAEHQRAEAEARKRNVTAELLATEDTYHRRLQRMRAGYLEPLEAELRCLRPLLSREQLAGVFGNIDDVLQHSAALLHDLRLALGPHDAAAAAGGGQLRFGP